MNQPVCVRCGCKIVGDRVMTRAIGDLLDIPPVERWVQLLEFGLVS